VGLPCNNDGDDTSCSEESNHATRSADPFCFVRYAHQKAYSSLRISGVGPVCLHCSTLPNPKQYVRRQ
jgi:hypothetical protein